ncbi:MAG: ion transporter [Gammaproteobacteria bacterium WSBS_2016_MAG_OTU1]
MFTETTIRWRDNMRRLRDNKLFELFTVAVIIFSSINIGAKSYPLPPWIDLSLNVLDWVVTIYFVVEITVRYLAEGNKTFWRRGWNIFDFFIVVVSLIPINESEYALLARLLRLFRVMRLVFFVPQLRMMVEALLIAIPRIGYVALMMFIIFYIYGAAGNLFFADINNVLWGNVGIAMLTLFRIATFEDWTDVMYETMEVYPFSWIYYLTFIFLNAFVFLNMMIGVVINVMQEAHDRMEKEEHINEPTIEQQLAEINHRLKNIEANTVPPADKSSTSRK